MAKDSTKKKLVFDLPEEEYDEFVSDANEIGASKIGLFRKMWGTYRMLPPMFLDSEKSKSPGSKHRDMYLGLAFSAIGLLSTINSKDKATFGFINTPQQEWDLWVNRLREIADCLAEMPVGINENDFKPPKAPEWFGLAKIMKEVSKNDK